MGIIAKVDEFGFPSVLLHDKQQKVQCFLLLSIAATIRGVIMAARRYMNINVLRYYLPVELTLTQILRKSLLFEREEIYTFRKMLQVTPTAILLLLSA